MGLLSLVGLLLGHPAIINIKINTFKVNRHNSNGDNLKPKNCLPFINPIALRKAKIVYNFGLSECNTIKVSLSMEEFAR